MAVMISNHGRALPSRLKELEVKSPATDPSLQLLWYAANRGKGIDLTDSASPFVSAF
ncbi:hypothetical protein MA16_Dca022180 [Dendrobium catenatum]|uniref:Uncharacterized protein n=1 Tax=Dendrobium catenatum TaxID=906689 RepID=A0A2I0VXJ1_9ASPA|nr:hypothetical protein MA16_Dca022180 [Dendrobium catenatum]